MSRKPQRILAAGASLLALAAGAAQADQVFNDDVIATFSLCVGNDCVSGESFGFDTIRLKENNTRIKFQDTSNSASFPTNDWQLTANSSDNGGGNYFSIDDVDGSSTPFLVEAGAGNNAVYVKSTGYVGFGTSSPVVDLHVKQGNSPALRLEQDGSSGFSSQAWDIAGNETNFFIRDVTNSSKLPFKIKPGAPTNALFVAADGDIGMGTQSPDVALDIVRSGDVILELTNSTSGVNWQIKNQDDEFRITTPPGGSTEQEFSLDADGNLEISGLLSIRDGVTAPAAVSAQAQIYVDAADGDLKVMFADGNVQVLAAN